MPSRDGGGTEGWGEYTGKGRVHHGGTEFTEKKTGEGRRTRRGGERCREWLVVLVKGDGYQQLCLPRCNLAGGVEVWHAV